MGKYIKVSSAHESDGSYFVVPLDKHEVQNIFDDLSYSETGEGLTITVVEMTEAEFKALPEFVGF